jgi:tetratricopeptide (TPR) repeat protein
VSDLLIGVLSALLATNQPATVSNLLYKKTGVAVPVINQTDPVERAYKKLMLDDDVAQEEVEQWIKESQRPGIKSNEVEAAALRARIRRRFEPVKKAYEDFLQAHPRHVNARVAYASFLNDIGAEDDSEAEWQKARDLDPADPAIWNNLANYYGHNGDTKKSFEYYAKAIALDPNESVYYQNLANCVFLFRKDAMEYYEINEEQVFRKSLDLYRKALDLDPNNFLLATEFAQTYYGIKPPRSNDAAATHKAELKLAEEALTAWRIAFGLAGDDLQREGVYIHFARWQIDSGRFDDARQSLNLVTNQILFTTKERLLKKLSSRELPGPQTNAAPKSP